MKKNIKLLLTTIILLLQFSCADWMNLIPPQGLIREEFWKTKEDVQAVVMGAYENFALMDGNLFRYGEIRGDLVAPDVSLSQDDRKIMESNIYPDNYICNWANFYKVINYCNEVIKYGPQVRKIDDTFTDYQLQGYLSEAYFLRSLAYFYLVRIYKDVPLVLEPTATDDANVYIPKTDGDEVINHIINDLINIRNGATIDKFNTIEMTSRATRAAIDALLADMYLWSFDYEKCITSVDNVLSSKYPYKLLKDGEWFQNYYPGNSQESIFEFKFSDALYQRNSMYGLTQENSNNYIPSEAALKLFANDYITDDSKREPYRGEGYSIAKPHSKYIIWKFVGRSPGGQQVRFSTEQNSCDWIVYRLADLYLMKAEALSQLNRWSEAKSALNMVHTRATGQVLDPEHSPTKFEDVILDERSRELAFEGKRWFDLLRMGRRNNYARKNELIAIIIKNAPSTQKRVLQIKLSNPMGWYLPIYASELQRNKALIQNPYYNY